MTRKNKAKSYPLKESILYNLKSKNKLASLLHMPLKELNLLQNDTFYSCFQTDKGRNIQSPQDKLYIIHKYINKLLSRVELPKYLHSGRKKRSSITNARVHLRSNYKTLAVDIENFFPSTLATKVFNLFFNIMKQSPDVAKLLTNLVTYNGYIPTGSPLSMNLAFFSNIAMFDELYHFADNRCCKMTVFVDDLTFTGKAVNKNFLVNIEKIITKYNLKIKHRKTNFFYENSPKFVTGVVIKNNKIEPEYEQLKKLREDEYIYKTETYNKKNQLIFNGRLAYLSQISANLKIKMDIKKITDLSN